MSDVHNVNSFTLHVLVQVDLKALKIALKNANKNITDTNETMQTAKATI